MPEKRGRTTLSESLIVFGIVMLTSGVVVVSQFTWRGSSNEGACMASLRSLVAVNEQYRTRLQSYASTLRDLEAAGLIDTVLGDGTKSGYDFLYTGGEGKWLCQGNPSVPGTTGDRYFFADQRGVIRFSLTGPANTAHPMAEWRRRGAPAWLSQLLSIIGLLALVAATVNIVIQYSRRRRKLADGGAAAECD